MNTEPWLAQWAQKIGVGGVAFDIGANAGDWTGWLKTRFASVISLEPDLRCQPPAGCEYDRSAVWHTTGAGRLFRRTSALQSSMYEFHEMGDGGQAVHVVATEVVATVTLDDLANRYGRPDFIKMDIEGAEVEAISSATLPCFSECRWLIELHNTRDALAPHLDRLGYEHCEIIPHPSKAAAPGHEWLLVTR